MRLQYCKISLLFINISSLVSPSVAFNIGYGRTVKGSYNTIKLTGRNYEFQTSFLQATADVEEIIETDVPSSAGKSKTKLCFSAKREFESDPMLLSSESSLDDFFRENKSLILKGEGNDVEVATDDMYNIFFPKWTETCEMKGFAKPGENDIIYKIINTGAEFPGIQIMSRIHMGCKHILSSESESGFSELEFVMLDSEDYAEGPRFLVWLFNKLTGNNKREGENEEEGENSTRAYTRFFVQRKGKNDITFISNVELGIDVEFPSVMLKVMPLSKEKAEEKGSASILKVLEKESKATLDIWQKAYESWLKSN